MKTLLRRLRTLVPAVALWALAAAAQAQQAAPDPAHMNRSALQTEVNSLRPFVENGGVEARRPAGCASPESRQFDFWIGEWDVFLTGEDMVVGEATVTSLDQGCSMLEDFRPFQGGHGHGLFGYDSVIHKWRQTFLDATGVYGVAQGSFSNGVMSFEITEPPPPPRFPADMQRRINFQATDADAVHQWGERLDPATHTWVKFFDLTFRRRGARS